MAEGSNRNWMSWINGVLIILVGVLLKAGIEDFKKKQDDLSHAVATVRREQSEAISKLNDKLSSQEIRMQKMEDAQNIWLTTIPKIQEEHKDILKQVESHDKTLQNHEWRIQSLENERRKP